MKYKACIFDLDGTLVHSSPEHRYLVVGKTLKKLGTETSREDIDRFWFEARRDEIIEEIFKVNKEQFWSLFRKYDDPKIRLNFTKAYSDVEVIKEIRSAGMKTGILTGAPIHIANLEIGLLGKENFDVILSTHDSEEIKPKPDPSGLIKCLNFLNVRKGDSLYVGNSDEDILAAQSAGIYDILLDRKEHEFPEVNPSLKINSLYELRDFLGISGKN